MITDRPSPITIEALNSIGPLKFRREAMFSRDWHLDRDGKPLDRGWMTNVDNVRRVIWANMDRSSSDSVWATAKQPEIWTQDSGRFSGGVVGLGCRIKEVMFEGLTNYDQSSCHPRAMRQIMRALIAIGVEGLADGVSVLDDALSGGLARLYAKHGKQIVKQAYVAALNAQTKREREHMGLPKEVREAIEPLGESAIALNETLKAWATRGAKVAVPPIFQIEAGRFVNAVGHEMLDIRNPDRRRAFNFHVMAGLEVSATHRAVIAAAREGVHVVSHEHDGFVVDGQLDDDFFVRALADSPFSTSFLKKDFV